MLINTWEQDRRSFGIRSGAVKYEVKLLIVGAILEWICIGCGV